MKKQPFTKKPLELEDLHDYFMSTPKIETVSIQFDDNMSHYAVLWQVITALAKKGFATRKEIAEEWLTLLKSEVE